MLHTKCDNINGHDGVTKGRDVPKDSRSIQVRKDTDLEFQSSKNSSKKACTILNCLSLVAMELVVLVANDTLIQLHNQAV